MIEALKSIAKTLLDIDLLEVKIAKEKELSKEPIIDEKIELFENGRIENGENMRTINVLRIKIENFLYWGV